MKKTHSGVTLIELMTVIVIVGILASIAVPAYTQYIRRSDRAAAKTALLENAQFMERNFTAKNSYAIDGADDEMTSDSLPVKQSPNNGTARYTITLGDDLSATGYTLIATPVAGSPAEDDSCGTLSVNHLGVKTASGGSAATCWSK